MCLFVLSFFFFQAEDGIRDLVRSRGLGDVYKRQDHRHAERPDRRLVEDSRVELFDGAALRRGRGSLRLSLIHI